MDGFFRCGDRDFYLFRFLYYWDRIFYLCSFFDHWDGIFNYDGVFHFDRFVWLQFRRLQCFIVPFYNPRSLIVTAARDGYDFGSRMTLTFDVVPAKFCCSCAVVDPVYISVVADSRLIAGGERAQVAFVLVVLVMFVLVDHDLAFV